MRSGLQNHDEEKTVMRLGCRYLLKISGLIHIKRGVVFFD